MIIIFDFANQNNRRIFDSGQSSSALAKDLVETDKTDQIPLDNDEDVEGYDELLFVQNTEVKSLDGVQHQQQQLLANIAARVKLS